MPHQTLHIARRYWLSAESRHLYNVRAKTGSDPFSTIKFYLMPDNEV